MLKIKMNFMRIPLLSRIFQPAASPKNSFLDSTYTFFFGITSSGKIIGSDAYPYTYIINSLLIIKSGSEVYILVKQYQKEIMLLTVRWYLKYPLSYRNIAEMMEKGGLTVRHTP